LQLTAADAQTLAFQMREILASSVMLDVLRDSGKDCEHNPDLYYHFTNEVHWPLFLDFIKSTRGLNYESLPVLEQVDICIDPQLLADFLQRTPRFHFFRSRFYFYRLSLADVTEIDLFELSDEDVLAHLNSQRSEKPEKPNKLVEALKRLFKGGYKSRV
jgi:hypothetical protein